MPVKKRFDKRVPMYPEALLRLLDGEEIEDTEENQGAVIELYFFNRYPDPPQELRERCRDTLNRWSAERKAQR